MTEPVDADAGSDAPAPPRVGVVVIGRNEGDRLVRCLASIAEQRLSRTSIVYVDSASTDESVSRARASGAEVVELDVSLKFTAARARNAGFRRLVQLFPQIPYVQFVDGDCTLDEDWLLTAARFLDEHPRHAVVCGRRREIAPSASVYNQLCDLEWDTPIGLADACGGDSLMRVDALQLVEGFNESLIAGEEPELCFRIRGEDFQVERIDAEMTRHDAAMTHASQWFKRTRRSGHAFAEMAALHGSHDERPGVRQTASNLVWGLLVPVGLGVVAATTTPWLALAGAAAGYGRLYFGSYRYERTRQSATRRSPAEARVFAMSCVLGKLPSALGALSYGWNRLRRKPSTLMEYKS